MDGVLVVLNKGECWRPVCTCSCTMFMLLSPQRYNRPHMCPAIAAKVQGGPGGVGSCGYMYSPSLPSRLSADCEDQARCEYCFTDLAESKTAWCVTAGGGLCGALFMPLAHGGPLKIPGWTYVCGFTESSSSCSMAPPSPSRTDVGSSSSTSRQKSRRSSRTSSSSSQ